MPRTLNESVVVITGASSGVGRKAALEFAREGASVVLAARCNQALEDAAQQCREMGGRALAVPTDVTDEEAVRRLARQAAERFGRLDVWVNNAAVTLFARIEEAPMEDFRRVIETNLLGYVHGIRAALSYFREQGGGVLINVSSVASEVTQPYTSAYVCSKAAIDVLAESLRMELLLDDARSIHVCTVRPATIDTPIFQHAANYTGRAVQAMAPVTPVEEVARAILRTARRPRREVIVGRRSRQYVWARRLAPRLFEPLAARKVDRDHLSQVPSSSTPGNLYEPIPQLDSPSGGWLSSERRSSPGAWAALALAAALPAAAVWLVANRRASHRRGFFCRRHSAVGEAPRALR